MKCLLHIGTEKTGTTILQNWLYDNKAELSKAGVYLSDNLGKTNNRLISAYFQGYLGDWGKRNGVSNDNEKERYFDGFIERLTNEILTAKKSHKVFVITSEHLHSRVRKKEEIERLHAFLVSVFDEVEVVCYFRDQFDLAVSLYSTALKGGSTASLESFIDEAKPENYYYNHLRIADNWSEVFGRGNCNFRIYDRSKFINNDIRLDLLSMISSDIDTTKLNMNRSSINESLSLLQSAALKAINRNIPYWASDKHGVNKDNAIAKRSILSADSLKIGKITSMKGELIRNRFAETNAIFFEKYFTAEEKFPISSGESCCTITCDQVTGAVEDVLGLGLKISAKVTTSLTEEQIDSLRDIALRLYDRNPNYVKDALALMKIALNHRPHGPLIKSKVEQWSAISNAPGNE